MFHTHPPAAGYPASIPGICHLFADSFQVNAGAAFNDQLIVDMSDDEAVPEGFHSVAEDVPANGLNDIFHKFRPVGFAALPFLCGSHSFISDGFSTELIDPDPGLDIRRPPAGGKLDEEHSDLIKEVELRTSVGMRCVIAVLTARSTSRQNAVIMGLEARQEFTSGWSSSSDRPMSRAPIDFKAPTEPPYPRARACLQSRQACLGDLSLLQAGL